MKLRVNAARVFILRAARPARISKNNKKFDTMDDAKSKTQIYQNKPNDNQIGSHNRQNRSATTNPTSVWLGSNQFS